MSVFSMTLWVDRHMTTPSSLHVLRVDREIQKLKQRISKPEGSGRSHTGSGDEKTSLGTPPVSPIQSLPPVLPITDDGYSAFRKFSNPLTFSTFCCFHSLNFKWIKLRFCVTSGIMFLEMFTNELKMKSWNVLSQEVFNPFVMASLNEFRSKNLLNMSYMFACTRCEQ